MGRSGRFHLLPAAAVLSDTALCKPSSHELFHVLRHDHYLMGRAHTGQPSWPSSHSPPIRLPVCRSVVEVFGLKDGTKLAEYVEGRLAILLEALPSCMEHAEAAQELGLLPRNLDTIEVGGSRRCAGPCWLICWHLPGLESRVRPAPGVIIATHATIITAPALRPAPTMLAHRRCAALCRTPSSAPCAVASPACSSCAARCGSTT